jgi:transposase
VARARLAFAGKSGEACADLAAMWGVTTQTVINWVERCEEGPAAMQGVPKKDKSRYRGRR